MSRCFPYPPPGYLRLGLVDETIKLEREKVLPKTEQKLHKKRERERKKEKKGKDKTRCPNEKLKKLDDVVNGLDDQLEKSDLTDEHGPPVCYASDGTQNCHKRKRETVSSRQCKVDGNKIKIRFSLKKPRISDSSLSEEQVCSSSVRTESVQEQSYTIAPVSGQKLRHNVLSVREQKPSHDELSVREQKLSHNELSVREQKLRHTELSVPEQKLRHTELSVPEQKLIHDELSVREQKLSHDKLSVPKQNPHHDDGRKEKGSSSSLTLAKDKKKPEAAWQYKTLIEDWMPPLLQLDHNDDDDDGDGWLFSTNLLVKPAAKRTDENDVTCRARAASFPNAHFLPVAEIYALPYTVPF